MFRGRVAIAVIGIFCGFAGAQTPAAPDSLRADTTRVGSARMRPVTDSLKTSSSKRASKDSTKPTPPFHPTWPVDSTDRVCREPLETAGDCWRDSKRWANQEIGFPGARSGFLDLSSLEPGLARLFYQPAQPASPYGLGGQLPPERVDERWKNPAEMWLPVLPLDTPITSLHWTRGALKLNQFTLNVRRMVGNRTYLGLQYHSDKSDSQFYDYSFNVHQPYLSGWGFLGQLYGPINRDSASLVISDTSHAIATTHIRPRVGVWIDSQTVVEAFGDWLDNGSSLASPTNPAGHDSVQALFPASFSAVTLGATAARHRETGMAQTTFTHSAWDRSLSSHGLGNPFREQSSGRLDRIEAGVSSWAWPGRPRLRIEAENGLQQNALWLTGAGNFGPAHEAWSDRETMALEAGTGGASSPLSTRWSAQGARRSRPDNAVEWLGGGEGRLGINIPGNIRIDGEAGWEREGASDDFLFRWQPVLGLYPNPKLRPRTDLHFGGGAAWESRFVEAGLSWDQRRYADAWLPFLLPEKSDSLPVNDSLTARDNYAEEIRDLLHLSLALKLGHWKFSLYQTALIQNTVNDDRLSAAGRNPAVPKRVYKGRILWHRILLGGKLDARTQWDWEWFSARRVYASNLDGTSRTQKLDEYLALDFTASMRVKTFLLYFRAMNFNHDRYATEPGVHPPGLNFRFGIDWRLWN